MRARVRVVAGWRRHALNCLSRGKNDKRVFVADELATCRDFSGVVFQRPFQRVRRHAARRGARATPAKRARAVGPPPSWACVGLPDQLGRRDDDLGPCARPDPARGAYHAQRLGAAHGLPLLTRRGRRPSCGAGQCNPEEAALVMTEPVCNLPAISDACDQMAFEDYGFAAYCRATGTASGHWVTSAC